MTQLQNQVLVEAFFFFFFFLILFYFFHIIFYGSLAVYPQQDYHTLIDVVKYKRNFLQARNQIGRLCR